LTHLDRQQLISPERGIDSESKQAQVTRLVGQDAFDIGDVFFGPDRFDPDRVPLSRPWGFSPFAKAMSAPSKWLIKLWHHYKKVSKRNHYSF
jgi:hypothetical protein